ncbi:Golgi resident protein GCP60 [Onthophagus taurus]|uniref:Golgi resident protein GCP60 n=1 Tax=Onthophagus taurus TaxID=166361 RepID=UPI0039BE3F0D
MAAVVDSSQVSENFEKLALESTNNPKENGKICENDSSKFGLPLLDVYKLAVGFYREKEGKAVHFSYEDKLQLVAFTQQVLHGPYSEAIEKLPPLGAFDVVGKDRRLAWQKLGNLNPDEARAGFVELLSRKCPLFSTFIEAHRREKKEQERLAIENEKMNLLQKEEVRKKEEEEKLVQERLEKEEAIKRQIQQALNEQTYDQFRRYAEQHYPGDPEKQGALVRQLQEQHYIQYMQQLQQVQAEDCVKKEENRVGIEENVELCINKTEDVEEDEEINEDGQNELVPASMWTRSNIEEFKKDVAQAEGDNVVRVAHGETVTVRVPTHESGTRLFWEFATDHYDIGFGVYFEYGTPTTNLVSVHISESEDEDREDLEDEYDDETIEAEDLESGSLTVGASGGISRPLLSEIVPVYRRDCQNEVYAGSHHYPGKGVYLLKFDNSYSLWRSKTLYYRVYYTQ